MKKTSNLSNKRKTTLCKKAARIIAIAVLLLSFVVLSVVPAMAAGDGGVSTSLTSFMDILFTVIKIVGVGIAAFGLIKVGVALISHDPNQRLDGLLFFAVGLFVFFAKEILQAIGVNL